MVVFGKDAGFRHMIPFFINIFGVGTFRVISDKAKGLKLITVRLNNIGVINMYDGMFRNPFVYGVKIGFQSGKGNTLFEASG